MTQPAETITARARGAMSLVAGRQTPFIFNEWYVAAFGNEISRSLLQRTLLGRSLVFFRSQAGAVVALDNRCPHRSFPLSSGTLDGDAVVCGYHGLRFNTHGDCIEAPSADKCPNNVGVRAYPTLERGPLVWIWMGDPSRADPATLPEGNWIGSDAWIGGTGYFHMQGSYVSLHENLLETSHLSFLHAKTIGTPDYVKSPTTTEINEGRFALNRTIYPTRLPPGLAQLTGIGDSPEVARVVRNEFLSPGYYEVTMRMHDRALPEEKRPEFEIRIAHAPTPETLTTCHYFIYAARNFGLADPASVGQMLKTFMAAFEEDVVGLALQEQMQDAAGDELYEISLPSDALSMAMRRYLKVRADEEQRPTG